MDLKKYMTQQGTHTFTVSTVTTAPSAVAGTGTKSQSLDSLKHQESPCRSSTHRHDRAL